jgi:FKBP-type peptidyl-prolyl cis-trans isomerase (trigger factor)
VRLGLVLSEVGEKNNIQVTDEEMQKALYDRVRQFPGQEQQVFEYLSRATRRPSPASRRRSTKRKSSTISSSSPTSPTRR